MSGAIALVQARMSSSRLPGKVMEDICGFPMVAHVMGRVAAAPGIARVVLCIADNDENRPLIEWAKANTAEWRRYHPPTQLNHYIGQAQPPNVLDLFCEAARGLRLDQLLVRITADCPALDPSLIRDAVRVASPDARLVSTSISDDTGWPDGQDVECFSVATLFNAQAVARAELATGAIAHREHVTTWMRAVGPVQLLVPAGGDASRARLAELPKLSVDTEAELAFMRRLHTVLGPGLWGLAAVGEYCGLSGDKP